mmetsp:Transcript_35103/g.55200  ORF Transcript_35103/g.55200 Transcript_35103/m.55200 type:complete len:303 (+) Transcript_35103:56-964(+)
MGGLAGGDGTTQSASVILDVLKDVCSSAVGGTCCVYVGLPLDVLKIRLQTEKGNSSIIQCGRRIFRESGVKGFWRGAMPALSGEIAENCVIFGCRNTLNRVLPMPDKGSMESDPAMARAFLIGSMTGVVGAVAICPFDVVKCRMQAGATLPGITITASMPGIMAAMVRHGGLQSLMVGVEAQIARDVPFYAGFFGGYHTCCSLIEKHSSMSDDSKYLVAGGLAGMLGWFISYPLDVAKTIIQTSANPKSLASTLLHIYGTKGVRGLYHGLMPVLLRAFPSNAALFWGYEMSQSFLQATFLGA